MNMKIYRMLVWKYIGAYGQRQAEEAYQWLINAPAWERPFRLWCIKNRYGACYKDTYSWIKSKKVKTMKKIMFNDKYGLTKAVLERRKTQTRRIIDKTKNEYFLNLLSDEGYMKHTGTLSYDKEFGEFRIDDVYECTTCRPMYKLGEVVAIAQSYRELGYTKLDIDNECITKAGLNNKMFVKAELLPHQIRITNVRIERLQDISYEDCIKEGIRKDVRYSFIENVKQSDGDNLAFSCNFNSPREAYAALIDKVSGKGTWHSNPFVFVYDFELIK